MANPKSHLTCCLCRKPIPARGDIYPLDAEWQRRFPKMAGTLACRCALNSAWACHGPDRQFVDGHVRAVYDHTGEPKPNDIDAWSHIGPPFGVEGAVLDYPWSGLEQGSEEYLRYVVRDGGLDPAEAHRIRVVIAEWDARRTRPRRRALRLA